jgi:hypothetical protein
MVECNASPGHLNLVRFVGGNTIPFISHSCEYFFSTIKHNMLIDILEEQLRIKFIGKVVKKDLAGWLRDCRQLGMSNKGDTVISVNEYYNEFGKMLNSVVDCVAYTCNAAGMFYTSLATDIDIQVKAGGYLSPEVFTSNNAQVQELRALRDLAVNAELEVATIVGISKHDNGVSMNSYHTQCMALSPRPVDSYDSHSSSIPVMYATLALANTFPPSPGFVPPPLYHEQTVFQCKTHRYVKFIQLYEVYAKCNHSVAECALFQAYNSDDGLFNTDKRWGCADFFPNDCFHQLWVYPHREYTRVRARALPFLRELTKRQIHPCQLRQPHNRMTLDQRISKWEGKGFRSEAVARCCYRMAKSSNVGECDHLQQEFRKCRVVSMKSDKDDQKASQKNGGLLEVDAFALHPIAQQEQTPPPSDPATTCSILPRKKMNAFTKPLIIHILPYRDVYRCKLSLNPL